MATEGRPPRGIGARLRVPLDAFPLEVEWTSDARVTAIVGPSGAGKSTLLRVLAGVERRAEGRLWVAGERWLDSGEGVFVPPWERRVGWVPQDALLFPHLDVRRNLAYAAADEPGGAEDGADVDEVAALLEVAHLLDRRPRLLSGGERQRVALGRALLRRPRLLLLDEPFAALDRPLRNVLAGRVRAWSEARSIPVVLVSHDEEDPERLGAERWILVEGRLRRA